MAQEAWGLTDKGYYCPTYEEILEEKIKRAKELFGDDIATSSATPLGKLLRIEAADHCKLYEEQEKVYYSLSPITATGVSLDRLCASVGIKRKVSICTAHLIRVFGTQGTVITAGTLFRSEAGIKFYATADAIISEYEGKINDVDMYYANVTIQCVDAGTIGNVYNINAPVTVNTNISEVQYYSTITEGENTETDAELRERYNTVVDGMGTNTGAAIIANVLRISNSGIHGCKIKNNTTGNDIDVTDKLTISADTYGVIVYAGDNSSDALSESIATAIYEKRPFGIRQSGVTEVNITDDAGEIHPIKFTYVDETEADVKVICTASSEFAKDGAATIKNNIENYINNLEIGESLIWSQLYGCIYSVPGIIKATTLTVNNATSDVDATLTDIIRAGTVSVSVITEV